MSGPVVEGVAPKLAVGGKIIGWNAGDGDRSRRGGIELEELGMGPDIRAVEGGEDRGIADDRDAEGGGTRAKLRPLAEKKILHEVVGFGAGGDLGGEGRLFRGGQGADFDGPFPPGLAVEVVLQRREQTVADQPVGVMTAESLEIPVGSGAPAITSPRFVSGEKQRKLQSMQSAEVDPLLVERPQGLDRGVRQQA